jgi:undecaprenyl-diphosphatase
MAVALGALAVFGLLTVAVATRPGGQPFAAEADWAAWLAGHRAQPWTALCLGLDAIGGGVGGVIVVPVAVAAGLWLARGPWAAALFAASSVTCALVVQLVKHVLARPRPPEMMVESDFGSFPSGHAANAAVMAAVIVCLFPRVWVAAVGSAYTLAMMVSRTYLGAHWITDTLAGLFLGVAVVAAFVAVFTPALRRYPRPPPTATDPPGPGAKRRLRR